MTLDLNTFSKTPAGHYLVRRLNEIGSKQLTRACTVRINAANANLQDIYQSVGNGYMTAKTAANLLRLLREEATRIQLDVLLPDHAFVSQLLRNVIIGKIKSLMRKCSVIRKVENGNVDEPTLLKKGSPLQDNWMVPKGPHHYTILGYNAGTIFPTEEDPDRLWREVPSVDAIEDETTPELLHERSLKRCIRQGKDWMNA